MTELTLHLPDDVLERLQGEARHLNVSVDRVISTAIERYLSDDDDEPTEEEILESIRAGMLDALAGRVRPAREVMAELRAKFGDNADES